VAVFAAVGGFLVFSSFAATVTQTKTWQTAAQWNAGSTLDHVVAADSGVTLATASTGTTTPAGTNLALKHPVKASSIESRKLPAAQAVDGNTSTRWASTMGKDPQWIYVDLGNTYSIREVKLQWEAAYAKAYQVQISSNAQSWTTVYSSTTGDGGIDDVTGINASGRYVRIYGTRRATQWGYSLWDFAVYGVSKSTPATYAAAGSITLPFDADAGTTSTAAVTWNSVTPQATIPSGTGITYQYATSTDNKTWSALASDITTLPHTRYLRITAKLTTTNITVTPTLTSLNLTYTIPDQTPPPVTTPAPTVKLTAAASSITSGTTTMLTWSSTNAATCTASGAWTGSKATSGTATTAALTQSSTFTLSCSGGGGAASASTTVTVTVPPVSGGGGSTSGGCTSASLVAPCIGDTTTAATGWGAPKFDDEFNGTSLNTTYWAPSWFSGGTMNDVSTSASNVAVTGGNLVLTLSSSSTGALVSSNPNDKASTGFSFGYGYAEARVLFAGTGSTVYNWPAWWTDGQSWPANGEIDIAEGLGGNLTSNYHSTSGANNSGTVAGSWGGSFHTYGVDREPGKNTIYWDGKQIRTYATNDGGAPEYLIFNVGGGSTTGASSQMKVDYVRVWQK
jgi:hypothetical protein